MSDQIKFDFNESISDKVDTIVKLIKNGLQKRASKLAKSIKEDIEKRTTKPPPSKPANNQFRNVQQGDTFRG